MLQTEAQPFAEQFHAPPYRRLRAYAFDPSLNRQLDTAQVNQATLKVRWEHHPDTGKCMLQRGPVGEYLAVVDDDPASGCQYRPVDLNDPHLLATDGLSPSEANPQFHQQMVYAVAMTTIQNFERALGRCALWSPHLYRHRGKYRADYVRRLLVYPHALREANAYYSPQKKALLFGYFPASARNPGNNLPGGTVFACLSHDIIAHETTHALLDGIHPQFTSHLSNIDVLAMHEAFADIVALFQHFTYSEVLEHQIARTRGDLAKQNLLGQLAHQFGQAIGRYGALRDSLGEVDPVTGEWCPKQPDPTEIQRAVEPHARGAILVGAMFDAFLAIYKSRIADLLRIASGGTGVLPKGELHPDLVRRLAGEAAKTAGHVLRIAIRALDYCPPVDVTFGDYLRAMITADCDLEPEDRRGYRTAFIEAFRRRGIYPINISNLSVDSLCWQQPTSTVQRQLRRVLVGDSEDRADQRKMLGRLCLDWGLSSNRRDVFEKMWRVSQYTLRRRIIRAGLGAEAERAVGLALTRGAPWTIKRERGRPRFTIHSVRPTHRIGHSGDSITDLVVEITQWRRGYFDPAYQALADGDPFKQRKADFAFCGGCTLLVDLESCRVRYVIAKSILDDERLQTQRRFEAGPVMRCLYTTYMRQEGAEPFALLHRERPEEDPT